MARPQRSAPAAPRKPRKRRKELHERISQDAPPDLVLGSGMSMAPFSDSVASMLKNASQGGNSTTGFLYQYSVVQQLLSTPSNQWIPDTTPSGAPMLFVQRSDGRGNTYYATMTATVTPGLDPANLPEPVVINNVTYYPAGTLELNLTATQVNVSTILSSTVIPILGSLAAISFIVQSGLGSVLLSAISNQALAGMPVMFQAPLNPDEDADDQADDLAEDAADEAAGDVAAGEATFSLAAVGAATFVPLAIVAVAVVLTDFIFHETQHNIYIYNLTNYDIRWGNLTDGSIYINEGSMVTAPMSMGSTGQAQNSIIQGLKEVTPPCGEPQTTYGYGSFTFISSSDTKGLGYVIPFELVDQSDDATVAYTANVAFDLPLMGANSLFASFGAVSDLQQYYDNMEGQNTVLKFEAQSSDSQIAVVATYDYLQGEHANSQGVTGYFYNSVVVFAPPSLLA
jgi:hypothetical protein